MDNELLHYTRPTANDALAQAQAQGRAGQSSVDPLLGLSLWRPQQQHCKQDAVASQSWLLLPPQSTLALSALGLTTANG